MTALPLEAWHAYSTRPTPWGSYPSRHSLAATIRIWKVEERWRKIRNDSWLVDDHITRQLTIVQWRQP